MATGKESRRLLQLGDSDFDIAEGQPDIRGWEVKMEDGTGIGEVEELLFDPSARKVRYLIVELDHDDLEDQEVVIPIGLAELDESDDDVILAGITLEQLRALPEYEEDRFDAGAEQHVCTLLGHGAGTDVYSHAHFSDDRLYRRRLPGTGNISHPDLGSGYRLQNRMEQSGSEVEGYMGGSTSPNVYAEEGRDAARVANNRLESDESPASENPDYKKDHETERGRDTRYPGDLA